MERSMLFSFKNIFKIWWSVLKVYLIAVLNEKRILVTFDIRKANIKIILNRIGGKLGFKK